MPKIPQYLAVSTIPHSIPTLSGPVRRACPRHTLPARVHRAVMSRNCCVVSRPLALSLSRAAGPQGRAR
eukprot:6716726-Prymnesium_polylepis.1